MTTLLISERVHNKYLMSIGDALHAWQGLPEAKRNGLYSYPKADIWITGKNGNIYLMTKRDLRDARIPFQPFDFDIIKDMAKWMSGDATDGSRA